MGERYDVAVIGGGVFGAWTAWHLQLAGKRVLLIDKYGPASARASSGGQMRVIRMAYGPDEVYTRMSWRSLGLWREFFARIARPELFRRTGVLWMAGANDTAAAQSVATLERLGIPHEVLDSRTLTRRYPQIVVPPGGWAIFEPQSGGLMACRAVQAVVEECLRAGTLLRIDSVLPPGSDEHGNAEHRSDRQLAAIRTVSGETISAARFVFACGPWLGSVLPDALGGRVFPTRQEVFYFGVPACDRQFVSPAMPVWLDFGRDYYGFPDIEGRGFKLAHDVHGEAIDPDSIDRLPSPERIAHAREFLALRFPALAAAPLLGAEVCQYENTSNGDFVIDRHPAYDNVWIAGGGSGHGFKHGPAVGEYLAERMFGKGTVEPRFSLVSKGMEHRREVH
jgi:sarcosine oxidase